jgi:hypothetical protein
MPFRDLVRVSTPLFLPLGLLARLPHGRAGHNALDDRLPGAVGPARRGAVLRGRGRRVQLRGRPIAVGLLATVDTPIGPVLPLTCAAVLLVLAGCRSRGDMSTSHAGPGEPPG